jgi:hypothetical protein
LVESRELLVGGEDLGCTDEGRQAVGRSLIHRCQGDRHGGVDNLGRQFVSGHARAIKERKERREQGIALGRLVVRGYRFAEGVARTNTTQPTTSDRFSLPDLKHRQ